MSSCSARSADACAADRLRRAERRQATEVARSSASKASVASAVCTDAAVSSDCSDTSSAGAGSRSDSPTRWLRCTSAALSSSPPTRRIGSEDRSRMARLTAAASALSSSACHFAVYKAVIQVTAGRRREVLNVPELGRT
eukprot:scaffold32866_cov101-Isochrysis_galbana.AAC.3